MKELLAVKVRLPEFHMLKLQIIILYLLRIVIKSYVAESVANIMQNKVNFFLRFLEKQYFELFNIQLDRADKEKCNFIHFINMIQTTTINDSNTKILR